MRTVSLQEDISTHPGSRPTSAAQLLVRALCVCALAAFSGCVTQSSGGGLGVTPGDGERLDTPEGRGEGQTRDELEARMRQLVSEQQGHLQAASTSPAVCEDLCSLATSICGVQEKLCVIADEHPGDDSYQGLCREAKRECKAAQDDCIGCVERHSGSAASTGATKPEPGTSDEGASRADAPEAAAPKRTQGD